MVSDGLRILKQQKQQAPPWYVLSISLNSNKPRWQLVSVSIHYAASRILAVCLSVSSLNAHVDRFSKTADNVLDTRLHLITSVLPFPYHGTSECHVIDNNSKIKQTKMTAIGKCFSIVLRGLIASVVLVFCDTA